MAIPTFVPPRPPSAMDDNPELKIITFEKGDGYTAETPDGLNHIRRVVTMSWQYLTIAQATALEDFLKSRKGTLPFAWTPVLETRTVVWTCKKWSVSTRPKHWRSLNVEFRQSFSLEI